MTKKELQEYFNWIDEWMNDMDKHFTEKTSFGIKYVIIKKVWQTRSD